jgi:hypothetical protein
MTLPASQQHLLDGIAGELRTTEPRLAGMFAVFTWLTRDEALPCAEQLEASARRPRRWLSWLSPRRLCAVASGSGRSRPRRLISRTRVLLLLIPLALMGLVIAIVGTSTPNARAACWAHQARLSRAAHQQAKTCLAAVGLRASEVWPGPGQPRTPAS